MKLLTKEWYQTMTDSGLGVCLAVDDRAAVFSEGLYQQVRAEKLSDWLADRRELCACFEEDYDEAVRWYRKAAEQGNGGAMYKLGECYKYGRGVEEDYDEAVRWYRKAAEQGNADAMCKLGECYKYGRGVEEDYDEAVRWYRKAAELGHDGAEDMIRFPELEKAAKQGDANAMYELGRCYIGGKGVRQDEAEGYRWYHKAAEQGNVDAKKLFEINAYSVPELKESAEQGDCFSMNQLGEYYLYGLGGEIDHEEALKWYLKAVEHGWYIDIVKMQSLMRCAYDQATDEKINLYERILEAQGIEINK